MFSLDSVLTAVGMVDEVAIMIVAVVIAVGVMLVASGPLSRFVHDHPTVKMLALSFLLLIGVTLIADGFGFHIDKAYIYAAMGFSVFVEALNLRARKRRQPPVELRPTFVKDEAEPVGRRQLARPPTSRRDPEARVHLGVGARCRRGSRCPPVGTRPSAAATSPTAKTVAVSNER